MERRVFLSLKTSRELEKGSNKKFSACLSDSIMSWVLAASLPFQDCFCQCFEEGLFQFFCRYRTNLSVHIAREIKISLEDNIERLWD